MIRRQNESDFEAATIERLKWLGYEHDDGGALRENPDFPLEVVVQIDALRRHLHARYPHLSPDALETAVRTIANPETVQYASACVLGRNPNRF